MTKTPPREEIEIKLRVQDIGELRTRLKRLHACEITPQTHEINTLYDTPRGGLRRRGRLIRLRIEQPTSSSSKRRPKENPAAILTFKGPLPTSRRARKAGRKPKTRSRFKIKEEVEVSVSGPYEMTRILQALGLHPVFRYEKFRTTYALPGVRALKIELDETPIGFYLELEGPAPSIVRAAALLGYDHEDYMTDTYGSLYLADCRRRGRKPGNMLFPPIKKLR
jgi:adenylate cyclase, class 2